MSRLLTALIGLGAWMGASGAMAQYDPGASRAENQINSTNRAIAVEQQNRAAAQQNQFELNAIRGQLSRPAPPPMTPPPAGGVPIGR